jgi:hypothetical protein
MKSISVKYIGPSNIKGARLKADDGDGNSVTIGYPHHLSRSNDEHHFAAVQALCQKMAWHGELAHGGTKEGTAWVWVNAGEATHKV